MHHGNLKQLATEQAISEHLPYASLEAEDIILTPAEDRLRVWHIEGLPVDTADSDLLNNTLNQRMKLFAHLPNGHEFRIYHNFLRTVQEIKTSANYYNIFANTIMSDYYADFSSRPLYENNQYLSLLHRLPILHRKKSLFIDHDDNKTAYQKRRSLAGLHIEEASQFIEQQLQGYGVQRLGSNNEMHLTLQFLAQLLNWQVLPVRAQPMDIRKYLPKIRLFFGERALEIYDNSTGIRHYAAILSIKGYAVQETFAGLLDSLFTLPLELCLTQSFGLIPTHEAREQITLQQRRLISVEDPDARGLTQLQEALGAVVAGDYALGDHQLSIMIVTRDLEQLEDHVAKVNHELLQAGLIPVRETYLMELAYWAQFPGNHQYLFRKITLHSGNMACLASFHSKTTGNARSFWGAPLLLLRTPERSRYWFNFHIKDRDVGDTLILGEKGSGKTLLLTMLATAALQYQPKIFYFDKDYGAENWIHAVKGQHIILGTGLASGLNPLQLPDTSNNRQFLCQWLRALLEAFGTPLNEEENQVIHKAIQYNFEHLKAEQRTLCNLQSAFGTAGPETLRNRLRPWHSDGEYAFYFDNPVDTLNFNNPICGFEMHYLLQDNQSVARFPVLLYLFHRIRMTLETNERKPTLIILDEAWSLLTNEYFAREIKNWLLTLRKLNAITIFATQNPMDILNHKITPILIAETVTKIIFKPNTPTELIYQNELHLTNGEYHALCQIPIGSRAFLVKQPDHAIVAQLDFTAMQKYIPILSSRPQQRQEILERVKQNPETWWEI